MPLLLAAPRLGNTHPVAAAHFFTPRFGPSTSHRLVTSVQ